MIADDLGVGEVRCDLGVTYADMRGKLDSFSDVAVKLENLAFPFSIDTSSSGGSGVESILAAGDTLYFCTPNNDTLLEWL